MPQPHSSPIGTTPSTSILLKTTLPSVIAMANYTTPSSTPELSARRILHPQPPSKKLNDSLEVVKSVLRSLYQLPLHDEPHYKAYTYAISATQFKALERYIEKDVEMNFFAIYHLKSVKKLSALPLWLHRTQILTEFAVSGQSRSSISYLNSLTKSFSR